MTDLGLDQTCTVYGENAVTGMYDTVLRSGLKCRFVHITLRPAATGDARAELAAMRHVQWEAGYVMPENVQLEQSGVRWQPRPGTFSAWRGPAGTVIRRSADAVRQS